MTDAQKQYTDEELQDLVTSSDSGGRAPTSKYVLGLILALAFAWSLTQLWVAQFQHIVSGVFPNLVSILGSVQLRPIHLGFAVALAYLAYPAFKTSPRDRVPYADWVLGAIGVFCCAYVYYVSGNDELNPKVTGNLTQFQIYVGIAGILVLAEVARRALGPALVVLGGLMILYSLIGHWPMFDAVNMRISEKSPTRILTQLWYSDDGVFGTPLNVSASTVFLFVLFGALLEKAGAGNYFIKLAFGGLGHLRGGPAKAAVVGSAATGLISGSSIANVVTTGVFTIPLMKRVGFTNEKAGAVEVASSVNGQIMPPVMGAAAFLMVEYIGIPYIEVVKHAFIPAVISYIALVYLVHLEALKNNFPALPKPGGGSTNILITILTFLLGIIFFALICMALKFPISFIFNTFGAAGFWVTSALVFAVFAWLCWIAAQRPDLEPDDPNSETVELPIVKEIYVSGLYYVLPIMTLIYLLMIEQASATKSAFWASLLLVVMMLTQYVIKGIARKTGSISDNLKLGLADIVDGMITGARNMIGVAIATAAAGIIVGVVSLTDLSSNIAPLVGILSMDMLPLMLILVGLFSLILGMGLPTTANYIIVSSIMAGVIVSLGASKGLVIPLIAAHLFVFYFGIMADVTPPVGLASFAAAAVSGGDPIKTGFTAFFYSLRTVLLPFLFIFNTDLILYGIDLGTAAGVMQAVWIFLTATIAMLVFAAATQGYFFARNKLWETLLLLIAAIGIFNPNILQNMVQPEFTEYAPENYRELLSNVEEGQAIELTFRGVSISSGDDSNASVGFTSEGSDALQTAQQLGYMFQETGDGIQLAVPMFGSEADAKVGQTLDFLGGNTVELTAVRLGADRLPTALFVIPALLLLGLVIMLQRRRQTVPAF